MARSRRTRFAASFVVCVAAGCSHEHPAGNGPGTGTATGSGSAAATPINTWYARKGSDGICWATPNVDCGPPGPQSHTCNPPASAQMPCPEGAPADGFQVVTFDGKTCFLADGKTAVTCPSYDVPPPAPPDAAPPPPPAFEARAWSISKSNGACWAELTQGMHCPPPDQGTCNPPAPTKVTCPPYNVGATVNERSAGACTMYVPPGPMHCPPKMHCNPPPPQEVDVACPGH